MPKYTVTAKVKEKTVATIEAPNALEAYAKVAKKQKDEWPESTYRVVVQRADQKRGGSDRVSIPIHTEKDELGEDKSLRRHPA